MYVSTGAEPKGRRMVQTPDIGPGRGKGHARDRQGGRRRVVVFIGQDFAVLWLKLRRNRRLTEKSDVHALRRLACSLQDLEVWVRVEGPKRPLVDRGAAPIPSA